MTERNPDNERIKRVYDQFLRHADGKSEPTIRQIEKTILRYEEFTDFADFITFDQQKAMAFKTHLADLNLAKATILSTVTALKRFFGWLAGQAGFKSKITLSDIEFLSLSERRTFGPQRHHQSAPIRRSARLSALSHKCCRARLWRNATERSLRLLRLQGFATGQ